MFSLHCISSSITQFGTALVNQQGTWYSKDKVTGGGTSQKTKRECETTSKYVAQLSIEFELWSNQICKPQISPFPAVIAVFILAMLQLLAFQNIRQSQKKKKKLENKQFPSFFRTFWWIFKLCFCLTKQKSKARAKNRPQQEQCLNPGRRYSTCTLLPQGTTTWVQVSFAMLLKQIPTLNKHCQAIFTFQNQEIIAVHHQLAPLRALPESWRMPMSEQSKRSPHRRQALNDLYTARLSRKHQASLAWISSNPWPICVC